MKTLYSIVIDDTEISYLSDQGRLIRQVTKDGVAAVHEVSAPMRNDYLISVLAHLVFAAVGAFGIFLAVQEPTSYPDSRALIGLGMAFASLGPCQGMIRAGFHESFKEYYSLKEEMQSLRSSTSNLPHLEDQALAARRSIDAIVSKSITPSV